MKRNAVRNGRAMSIPGGALTGAMYSLIWTLLASGLLGWLIHTQRLQVESLGYGSMVILLSSSILGAGISYRKVKRQRAISCLCAGGIYLVMLLAITALFFGGQYTAVGVTTLLVFGGSATAIFLNLEHRAGKGRKIRV